MRYVNIIAPVPVIDPVTDDPLTNVRGEPEMLSVAKVVRVLLTVAAQKQAADMLLILDIRAKFDAAQIGEWVELSEEMWKVLEAEAKRPGGLAPAGLMSAGPVLRVILRAPEERPAVAALPS